MHAPSDEHDYNNNNHPPDELASTVPPSSEHQAGRFLLQEKLYDFPFMYSMISQIWCRKSRTTKAKWSVGMHSNMGEREMRGSHAPHTNIRSPLVKHNTESDWAAPTDQKSMSTSTELDSAEEERMWSEYLYSTPRDLSRKIHPRENAPRQQGWQGDRQPRPVVSPPCGALENNFAGSLSI